MASPSPEVLPELIWWWTAVVAPRSARKAIATNQNPRPSSPKEGPPWVESGPYQPSCRPKTSTLPRESFQSTRCCRTFAAAGNTRIDKFGLGTASFGGLLQIPSSSHRRSSVRCAGKYSSGCAPVHGTWLVFVEGDLTFVIPYGNVRSVTPLFKYDDGQSAFCMAVNL